MRIQAVLFATLVSACAASAGADHDGTADGGVPGGNPVDGAPSTTDGGTTATPDAHSGNTGSGSGSGGSTGSGSGTGSLTLIVEPADGMTPIYTLISSATTSIDMTMYELTDTTVTGLLTTAAGAGKTVRVILDQNLEKSSNTTAYNALKAGGVSVHWANTTYSATHQKTITVDHATSAIMSLNLTPEYYSTTRDFAVITHDASDVAAIETTFADDFANTSVTPPTGADLVWSPTNAQTAMLAVISGAQHTLVVENEEMSDSDVVSALSAAAERGVTVEVIMTDSSDWSSEFKSLNQKGVKVVTYAATASLYIHAKVILADKGDSGAKVFVGSENFSSASLTQNRELGLITTNATIIDGIATVLASDYSGGTAY